MLRTNIYARTYNACILFIFELPNRKHERAHKAGARFEPETPRHQHVPECVYANRRFGYLAIIVVVVVVRSKVTRDLRLNRLGRIIYLNDVAPFCYLREIGSRARRRKYQ